MATDTSNGKGLNIHPKVIASTVAGAVTIIIVWAVGYWGKVQIPPEVASSVTTVVGAIFGYLIPGGSS